MKSLRHARVYTCVHVRTRACTCTSFLGYTCTCGLDGHDARFTRERSRVRVTARVRFFFSH